MKARDSLYMSTLEIRPIVASDEAVVSELLYKHWGDRKVVSRGEVCDVAKPHGVIASKRGNIVELVT